MQRAATGQNDRALDYVAQFPDVSRPTVVLESSIQACIHRIGVLLGQSPDALIVELSKEAPIPAAPPEVPVGLPSGLLLRRPDVQRAERQLAAMTANIGVAKADLFPKFSLTGVAGFQSVSASDWFSSGSKFWSIGPTVQWKIFDSGRIRASIKVQTARQEQALAAYEQTVLTAFEDAENALVFYAKQQMRRRSLEDAVRSSRDSLHLANQLLYTNGLSTFINVLDAERSLYQAEDALAQSDKYEAPYCRSLWSQFAANRSPALSALLRYLLHGDWLGYSLSRPVWRNGRRTGLKITPIAIL